MKLRHPARRMSAWVAGEALETLVRSDRPAGAASCGCRGGESFDKRGTQMSEQQHMVRTYSAGVWAGKIEERNGKEVRLSNARRIWYWAGAATLSQLATDGTSKPKQCKFPRAVEEVVLTEAIEIIPITAKAQASLDAVPVWQE